MPSVTSKGLKREARPQTAVVAVLLRAPFLVVVASAAATAALLRLV